MKSTPLLFFVLTSLVFFGCGQQASDSSTAVPNAVSGEQSKPKEAAVPAGKLQNRTGIFYIVNGQEPFNGTVQEFYESGQMWWEIEIQKGYITKLKR